MLSNMTPSMRALAVTQKGKLELRNIETPTIEKGYAIIKVAYSGICGSDLPRYFQGAVHQFPQVLGHEFSGIISEIESNNQYNVGDKVVVAPLIPCEKCKECQMGNPAMCTDYDFIGSRSQGSFSEYIKVPLKNIVKIPSNMSLKHAALVEPLTIGIHGVDRATLKLGECVMVMGAGTIGLLTVLSLIEKGAGEIIVVDINNYKLDKAKALGCTHIINPLDTSLEDFFKNRNLPTIVYETAGSNITQVQSVQYCGKKGQVVYIGTCTKPITFEPEIFEQILRKELILTGSWMSYSSPFPGYEWTIAIDIIARNTKKMEALITSVHQLDELADPFNLMIEPNNNVVKVLYQIDKEN